MERLPRQKERAIISAVLELLESDGYDALQLRVVAQRAQVSLRTIYKYFPGRDELIIVALECWMREKAYVRLTNPPTFSSVYDGLMWGFREVFGPWEEHPRLLLAFSRARMLPSGARLDEQGLAAMAPLADALLSQVEASYAQDLVALLSLLTYAALDQFAAEDFGVADLLLILERAVFRLTTNNEPAAALRRSTPKRSARPTRRSG